MLGRCWAAASQLPYAASGSRGEFLGLRDGVDDRLRRHELLIEDIRLRNQRDDEHGLTGDERPALDVVDQLDLLVADRQCQRESRCRGVRPVRNELNSLLVSVRADFRDSGLLSEEIGFLRHTRGEVALVAGSSLEIERADTVEEVNPIEALRTDRGQRSRRVGLPGCPGPGDAESIGWRRPAVTFDLSENPRDRRREEQQRGNQGEQGSRYRHDGLLTASAGNPAALANRERGSESMWWRRSCHPGPKSVRRPGRVFRTGVAIIGPGRDDPHPGRAFRSGVAIGPPGRDDPRMRSVARAIRSATSE